MEKSYINFHSIDNRIEYEEIKYGPIYFRSDLDPIRSGLAITIHSLINFLSYDKSGSIRKFPDKFSVSKKKKFIYYRCSHNQ